MLLSGFFDFDYRLFAFELGGGFVYLALEFIAGLLELPEALTKSPRQLRKFFRTKKKEHDDENKNDLGPSRHGQG